MMAINWRFVGPIGVVVAVGVGCAHSALPQHSSPVTPNVLTLEFQARASSQYELSYLAQEGAVDELWIIARKELAPIFDSPNAMPPFQMYGFGQLHLKPSPKSASASLPLTSTDVVTHIIAHIASVRVRQLYRNPFSKKIEAVYEFPLPHNAAVGEFAVKIGSRRIRGIIRERGEAERIYREAKRAGFVASLLSQDRPNVLIQRIGNIVAGATVEIECMAYAPRG